MKAFYIESGFFSTDGGAMFGIMSHKVWASKYPVDGENRCPLAMRCLFVDFGERRVLFDAGVGSKPTGMSYYRFHDLQPVEKVLAEKGYRREDITDVVLSHLHFDHCGGCTYTDADGRLLPTFPKARHWTTLGQWNDLLHPCLWEGDAFLKENVLPLHEAGLLEILRPEDEPEGGFDLFPGLVLRVAQGHTPDQLVSFIRTDQGNLVFSGDVVPMCLHITPGCIAAIDNHASLAMEEKLRILKLAADSDSRLVFYHDACTASATLKTGGGHILPGDRQAAETPFR